MEGIVARRRAGVLSAVHRCVSFLFAPQPAPGRPKLASPDRPQRRLRLVDLQRQPLITAAKQEHIRLKSEAQTWRSLHSRAVKRMEWQAEHVRRELLRHKAQAAQRETALRVELELARAKLRDLQQSLFGRKSEQRKHGERQPRRRVCACLGDNGAVHPGMVVRGCPGLSFFG